MFYTTLYLRRRCYGKRAHKKSEAYDLLYRKITTCDHMPGLFLTEKDMARRNRPGSAHRFAKPLSACKRMDSFKSTLVRECASHRLPRIPSSSIIRVSANLFATHDYHAILLAVFETSTYCAVETRFQQSEQEESLPHFRSSLDAQFHTFLISITQNDILLNMYHSLMLQQVRLAMFAAHQGIRNREGNLEQHEEIIVSLLRENPEAAKDALIYHLNQSMVNSLKCVCQPDA